MPKPKHASSYSLTPEAKGLLDRLSESLGIPRSAVLEMSVRDFAERKLKEESPRKKSEKST